MSPKKIHFHKKSQQLELAFADGVTNQLSAEFLRVHSPSAEVRGHGKGQETLQVGKQDVQILNMEATGNYALKIVFSDGHDSGLFDWTYLHKLCAEKDQYWQAYLDKLEEAGANRGGSFINAKPV